MEGSRNMLFIADIPAERASLTSPPNRVSLNRAQPKALNKIISQQQWKANIATQISKLITGRETNDEERFSASTPTVRESADTVRLFSYSSVPHSAPPSHPHSDPRDLFLNISRSNHLSLTAMDTFHIFSQLPPEVRDSIWKAARFPQLAKLFIEEVKTVCASSRPFTNCFLINRPMSSLK